MSTLQYTAQVVYHKNISRFLHYFYFDKQRIQMKILPKKYHSFFAIVTISCSTFFGSVTAKFLTYYGFLTNKILQYILYY